MAMKRSTRSLLVRVILFLPVAVLLTLAFGAMRRGNLSPWHDRCVQFCQQSEWRKMTALAENLDRIGKADAETMFWGLFASTKLKEAEEADRFADSLLRERALNWKLESETAKLYRPAGLTDRLLMFRTRIVLSLLVLLVAIQVAALATRRDPFPWSGALATLGCILLLV